MRLVLRSFIIMISLTGTALAHTGHDEAPGNDSAGSKAPIIELSESAITNLGIQTINATLAPVAETLELNGSVSFLPERQAQISPRVEGKIAEIFVKVGESVKKGKELLTIQPNLIGSPIIMLSAPIDGLITHQNAVIGQAVSQSSNLMEVVDPSQVLVGGKVFETPQLARITIGQKVKVRTPVFGDQIFLGTIQRIDISLQGDNRTLDVFAMVQNPDHKLLAGMQSIMSVELTKSEELLTIPVKAILGEGGEYFVFVKNQKQFERRAITLGKKFGQMQEIIDGILPDEQVVVQGQYQLQYAKPAKNSNH